MVWVGPAASFHRATVGLVRFTRGRISRAVDGLVSTRGVILFMTVIMAGLTVSTARNYRLNNLPARDLLVVLSSIATVVGAGVAWVGPTPKTRAWIGGCWMVYCSIRASSFAWVVAGRTRGVWGFIEEMSPVLAWAVGAFFGFLVFGRRHSTPYVRDSREA
jgi:hypothetical protein